MVHNLAVQISDIHHIYPELQKLCKKSINFAHNRRIKLAVTGEKHSPEE